MSNKREKGAKRGAKEVIRRRTRLQKKIPPRKAPRWVSGLGWGLPRGFMGKPLVRMENK
jgi:hypothetical protein